MNDPELLLVQVFFRHGCRTPLHHVASPAISEAFWDPKVTEDLPHTVYPYELVDLCSAERIDFDPEKSYPIFKLPGGAYTGQLIHVGQQEAFDLGRRLKQVYVDRFAFISRTFDPSQTFFRSTYLNRTIKSLRCVLAGLFGESYKENGRTDKAIIHVAPLDVEFLFPNPKAKGLKGKLYTEGMEECSKSDEHNAMKQTLRKELCVNMLTDDMDPRSFDKDCPIWFVRDDYIARERAGFPIPESLRLLMPEISKLAVIELLWELLGKKEEWHLNVSSVVEKIFSLILCNMQYRNQLPKFQLYSCHDSMIAIIMYGLGLFDGDWPPFAADIIFELYQWREYPSKLDKFNGNIPKFVFQGQGLSMTKIADPNTTHIKTVSDWPREDIDKLWFRILYLGKSMDLACLWNRELTVTFNENSKISHLYPLSWLINVLVQHLNQSSAKEANGNV